LSWCWATSSARRAPPSILRGAAPCELGCSSGWCSSTRRAPIAASDIESPTTSRRASRTGSSDRSCDPGGPTRRGRSCGVSTRQAFGRRWSSCAPLDTFRDDELRLVAGGGGDHGGRATGGVLAQPVRRQEAAAHSPPRVPLRALPPWLRAHI